jgi:hypothetical protein
MPEVLDLQLEQHPHRLVLLQEEHSRHARTIGAVERNPGRRPV